MRDNNQRTLGVILAGGLSSRMKQDKATLPRDQHTMLEFSQAMLKKCNVDDVVISGNNHQIKDHYKNLGPLAGIFSVLQQCPAKALLIMPIDLPLIDSATLTQLKTIGELSNKACFYQGHPLPLYLPVNAFVEQFLQDNISIAMERGPSMKQLLNAIPHQAINLKNKNSLFNTNTPEEWQLAQQKLQALKNPR